MCDESVHECSEVGVGIAIVEKIKEPAALV